MAICVLILGPQVLRDKFRVTFAFLPVLQNDLIPRGRWGSVVKPFVDLVIEIGRPCLLLCVMSPLLVEHWL